MLNFEHTPTVTSLKELEHELMEAEKPILFWLGAGASSWAGFPRWQDLAKKIHKFFKTTEPTYNGNGAAEALADGNLPRVFSICKRTNESKYNRFLQDELSTAELSGTYGRLIDSLSSRNPLYIVTTNIDGSLERNIKDLQLVQKNEIESISSLILKGKSFILKIHGTVDNISSIVFTEEEYLKTSTDAYYLKFLEQIFSLCTVIFLGYSLSDDYIINLIEKNHTSKKLFGDGPHFAILNRNIDSLPKSIKPILYLPGLHSDHRSAIQVVEEVNLLSSVDCKRSFEFSKEPLESAHLIAHLYPPGNYQSGQRITFEKVGDPNSKRAALVGNGYTAEEMPYLVSTAMHDLTVGLVCFDKVYVPLASVGPLFTMVGEQVFRELISTDTLFFVHWPNEIGISFAENGHLGDLGSFTVEPDDGKKTRVRSIIESQLPANAGMEREANLLWTKVELATKIVPTSTVNYSVPDIARGYLLRKSIRKDLGISDGVSLKNIPKWNAYPIIRFSNLIQAGIACEQLKIASMRLEYGASKLAGPTFSSFSASDYYTDNITSYVLSGSMREDVGKYLSQNPTGLLRILNFRDTEPGIKLRKEILEQLKIADGSEIAASINGTLQSIISFKTLEEARERMTSLFTKAGASIPSIWSDVSMGERTLKLWREKSKASLREFIIENKIQMNDKCPCLSGERLGECCLAK